MTNTSNLSTLTSTSRLAVATDILNWADPTVQLVKQVVVAADERKGGNIVVLSVAEVSTLADYFVLITGFSRVQVRAIARTIEDQVEDTLQRRPRRLEGLSESTWVLIDYEDVVVHVQMPQEREFYNLEAFWGHAQSLPADLFLA
jgi:ribosome-associated protein